MHREEMSKNTEKQEARVRRVIDAAAERGVTIHGYNVEIRPRKDDAVVMIQARDLLRLIVGCSDD